MKIEFTLTDDTGNRYQGATELLSFSPVASPATGVSDMKAAQSSAGQKGLPDHILDLRSHGFFKEPRVPCEVHDHLQQTYHCEFERVKVALLRLQRRRELRKTARQIAGQERVAYVW